MKINKAYRYELKPNVQQRILLAKHAGTARFAYNWGLQQRIELYEKEKKSTNAIEQHRILNSLKPQEFPWMYEVSKCAPQEVLRDLDRAFKNFFRSLKTKKQVGFPKPKKKGRHDSFRLTGTIKIDPKAVQLPRLGKIRLKEASNMKGKILSATVARQADRQRQDFLHKLSTQLAKTKSVIVVEDLNVKRMIRQKNLSRSIADVGWTSFIHMLEYKTQWYGSCLKKAPSHFASTKTCSSCGRVVQWLTLGTREWECPCGAKHDRDINAAVNLLRIHTGSSPGIYACGDASGGESQKLSSYAPLKQELMKWNICP